MMNSNGMDVTLTNDTMRFSIIGGGAGHVLPDGAHAPSRSPTS